MGITNTSSIQAQDLASLQDQAKLRRLREELGQGADKEKKLKEATQGFESIFMAKMWERMRATVPKDDYLHSKEEDFYLSMFDRELSQKMADAGGVGLGKMLYDSLKNNLSEASQKSVPLEPLGARSTPLNPLPVRNAGPEDPPRPRVHPANDQGTMRELEQLIQKIEQEHGPTDPGAKLTQDV
ncbi:rod-binding protein [Desulfoplanes sp.]